MVWCVVVAAEAVPIWLRQPTIDWVKKLHDFGRLTVNDSNLLLRYDLMVPSDGRIEVQVPMPAGSQITVYVVQQQDSALGELTASSVSSTGFWDNPADDEDWNYALARRYRSSSSSIY
jgi:hypothetical protein